MDTNDSMIGDFDNVTDIPNSNEGVAGVSGKIGPLMQLLIVPAIQTGCYVKRVLMRLTT